MNKPNVNLFWEAVRAAYPDARFDFWGSAGELHFYRCGDHEASGDAPWACIRDDDMRCYRIVGRDRVGRVEVYAEIDNNYDLTFRVEPMERMKKREDKI